MSDEKKDLKWLVSPIQESLEDLRLAIFKSGQITESQLQQGCELLSDFHSKLKAVLSFEEDDIIYFSPSVNLFPMPMELVIGTACTNTNVAVVLVNDFAAAVDAAQNLDRGGFPSNLIAVGNPIPSENLGFDTLISDIRGMQYRSAPDSILSELAPLPDAELELEAIAPSFTNSKVFLRTEGSIHEALSYAEEQKVTNQFLVFATHGLPVSSAGGIELPGLLSVSKESAKLVTAVDLYKYEIPESSVMLSACDTAAGVIDNPAMLFTGFAKTFADIGSRRIISSLWPVKSNASRVFTETLVTKWKQSGSFLKGYLDAKQSSSAIDTFPFTLIAP